MGRRRYSSVSVYVDVDVSDVLDEIETEDLRAELQSRRDGGGGLGVTSEWIDRLRFYIDHDDIHGARAMLVSSEVQALVSEEARAAQYADMRKGLVQ